MEMRLSVLVTLVVVSFMAAFTVAAASPEAASAHRHGCHRAHTCPSDHATYRWRGQLCVAPYSDKRNSTFKRRVRYGGRTYYCKR